MIVRSRLPKPWGSDGQRGPLSAPSCVGTALRAARAAGRAPVRCSTWGMQVLLWPLPGPGCHICLLYAPLLGYFLPSEWQLGWIDWRSRTACLLSPAFWGGVGEGSDHSPVQGLCRQLLCGCHQTRSVMRERVRGRAEDGLGCISGLYCVQCDLGRVWCSHRAPGSGA